MNQRTYFSPTQTNNTLGISTRKQRLMAVRRIVVFLERIRNKELSKMNEYRPDNASPWRYEAEQIISIVEDAICILDQLY